MNLYIFWGIIEVIEFILKEGFGMIPRSEFPNPQWERKNWKCLNGEWEFEFDFSKSALERKLYEKEKFAEKIIVPFCPESELSGIGFKDFIPAVAYRKNITISKEELDGRVILHFGAVDYETSVFVNGEKAGSHTGGYSSFEFDITKFLHEGENIVFVYAEDDVRSGLQCAGKQSGKFESYGCFYTRVTGIWQSVWLEFVPECYVKNAKYYTDINAGVITITGETAGVGEVNIKTAFEGKETGAVSVYSTGSFTASVKLSELHLWELGCGNLYDLTISFYGDTVYSYFGMRNTYLDGKKYMLNDKSVFQRLVLDQGFYPDGIYTAKDDSVFIRDIELSLAAGFNGARLHEKVFEPRFLYYCDKMGYMVWGEQGNWGFNHSHPEAVVRFINEWTEVLNRDFNHPSIIGWCPFNETWDYVEKRERNRLLSTVYKITKIIDTTRPCIDTSGNYHVLTDIYDVHDYEQDPDKFKEYYAHIKDGIINDQIARASGTDWQKYEGGPVFISEYGGIKLDTEEYSSGWGYGTSPKTLEELIDRYKRMTDSILDNEDIMGFCYTQLYDVEQEQNGLYTYERKPKFDMEVFKKINIRKAKIEE